MIILNTSLNFPAITLQQTQGPFLVIVLATDDNVVLGRNNLTNGVFVDWSRRNAYYFGTWPFNEALEARTWSNGGYSGGTTTIPVGGTRPYILNAGGSYADVNTGTNPPTLTVPATDPELLNSPYTNKRFVYDGQAAGGRIYNVNSTSLRKVLNEDYLH